MMVAPRPALLVVVTAAALGACSLTPGLGAPLQSPDVAALRTQGGVLPSLTASARLNGILARLSQAGAPDSGPWRVLLTRSLTPSIEALPDGRIMLTRGMVLLAADEAQMAGVLALGMVAARLAATEPPADVPASAAEKVLDLPDYRRRMIARLAGYAGSETGDAATTALSLVASAGYDPAALVEIATTAPANTMGLDAAAPAADLAAALPAVQREFTGATERNARPWRKLVAALPRA